MLSLANLVKGEWQLVWHDEFDKDGLDLNKWKVTDGMDKLEGIKVI